MKIKRKHWDYYQNRGNLPRKIKKVILGEKMGKAKLRRLIANTVILQHKYPTAATILPGEYCPKCGCQRMTSYDHGAPYPEVWISYHCGRCGNLVAQEDNSPYTHSLWEYIPESRVVDCGDDCPCKKGHASVDEEYWQRIVPTQIQRETGIRIPTHF